MAAARSLGGASSQARRIWNLGSQPLYSTFSGYIIPCVTTLAILHQPNGYIGPAKLLCMDPRRGSSLPTRSAAAWTRTGTPSLRLRARPEPTAEPSQ